jgi:glycosyltransferase involved in cell wall biosynthesis
MTESMIADGPQPALISVIVPVYNSSSSLGRCLEAIVASDYPRFECVVVDDTSTDDSRNLAGQFPVRVLDLPGGPFGSAYARNRGAEVARGEILFFVDADVVLPPDTLAIVAGTFADHPQIDAVFGSYDDSPEAADFLSRYKNLFHHFVHQQASEDAMTFWSGCGAVRRKVFFEAGGFAEDRYPRPSIEDIELGHRLRATGHRIVLNKDIQVKHLKRWTLRGMITSDVFDRAVPWTELLLQQRRLPNDLNLHLSHRASALLLYVVLLYVGLIVFLHHGLIVFFHHILLLPLLAGLFLLVAGNWSEGTPHFQMSRRARRLTYVLIGTIAGLALYFHVPRMLPTLALLLFWVSIDRWVPHPGTLWKPVFFGIVLGLAATLAVLLMSLSIRLVAPLLAIIFLIMLINYQFYVFFTRKAGVLFALAVIPFHLFYYLYSVIAFVMGAGAYIWHMRRTDRDATGRRAVDRMQNVVGSRGFANAVYHSAPAYPLKGPKQVVSQEGTLPAVDVEP